MRAETIAVERIDEDANQPRRRFDESDTKSLAKSLRQHQLLQPIVLFRQGERYRVIDGHRRLRATRLLRSDTINAIVLDAPPDAETLLMTQLDANCMRVDLTPLEQAVSYERLQRARGWNNSELAEQLGRSPAHVTRVLSYLKLPREVQELLAAGELAGSTAYAISRAEEGPEKEAMVQKALARRLKRDEANASASAKPAAPQHRTRLWLLEGEATLLTERPLDSAGVVAFGKAILQAGKQADRENLDIKTLERVLRDKSRASRRRTPSTSNREVTR